MKEELYKKVYIKTEKDLPKVDGDYICHHQGAREDKLDVFPFKVKESYWFVKIDWYLQPVAPEADIAKTETDTGKIVDMPEIVGLPPDSDRDWKEDFSHENGNYVNKCIMCGKFFKGHKRRVICVECYKKGNYQPHKSVEEILEERFSETGYDLHFIQKAIVLNAMEEYANQKTEIPEITDEEIEEYFKTWINPRIKTADEQYEKWLNQYLSELIDSAVQGANWYREELKRRSAGTITTKDLKDIDDANDDKGKV